MNIDARVETHPKSFFLEACLSSIFIPSLSREAPGVETFRHDSILTSIHDKGPLRLISRLMALWQTRIHDIF